MNTDNHSQDYIVVFDGVCNMCNWFVNFLLRHDKKDRLRFALLQDADKLGLDASIKQNISSTDSVAFIADGKVYFQSTAVLKILKRLGRGWQLFYIFIIIPKPVCDWFYDFIARNRYKWFGKKDSCMVPDEKVRGKFIGM
jgi:predicted DCC family thiol-disulfide oxidoreductase YuxK